MHKRLITFGCSNTYGHGLPDCHIPPNEAGPHPSKYAWPQLLADRRQLECVNLGQPGGSNKLMWWRTVNFEFEPTDVVIYYATEPNRDAILNNAPNDNRANQMGTWSSVDKRVKAFHRYVAQSNSAKTWEYQSYVHIDHAYQHVLRQGVKDIFHFKRNNIVFQHKLPKWATFKFQPIDIEDMIVDPDLALDKSHDGPKSHKQIARRMDKFLPKF
jgi:hypothetical protein